MLTGMHVQGLYLFSGMHGLEDSNLDQACGKVASDLMLGSGFLYHLHLASHNFAAISQKM